MADPPGAFVDAEYKNYDTSKNTTAGPDRSGNNIHPNPHHPDSTAPRIQIENPGQQERPKQTRMSSTTANNKATQSSSTRKEKLRKEIPEGMEWLETSALSIVVIGASGDLAKKKTFPSLLNLFADGLLPDAVRITGYARSDMTNDDLRERIRPYLKNHDAATVDDFLQMMEYQQGSSYGDIEAFRNLAKAVRDFEQANDVKQHNRLFYFAIPPSAFSETALAIKETSMQDEDKGWSRLIVEKPFGKDLESFEELNKTLAEHFDERHLYRIDHYLGKELVQNLTVIRFSNIWLERVWNADNVKCIILTFKEDFGTEGRGGYFDQYGIIRDILQNHLLQVLTLMCMEAPYVVEGPGSGRAIRDAKVQVLNAMEVIQLEDVVLGQYEGYADDPSIKNKDTNTPTFATIHLRVNTPRWRGVPIIMKAGKALNEKKAEMRVQFKDAPAADSMFKGSSIPRNELVMRLQPHEAVYLKTNVKSPGFTDTPVQSELEVNYDSRFFSNREDTNPDAYTRLILDVLQGKQATFVRDDELRRAWEIFTPILHKIEKENIQPIVYKQGSRGPEESDQFINERAQYSRNENYSYNANESKKSYERGDASSTKEEQKTFQFDDAEKCDIGLYGLAVMGQNFALNMAEHGFKVCVGNRSHSKVDLTVKRAKEEGDLPIVGSESIPEFVARLRKPRKVIILVQAGNPVDQTIAKLAEAGMEAGDIIIDGGNEWFPNSIRRSDFLAPHDIHFIGMGISGGEEGARKGPSLMPGGPKEAYAQVEEILTQCAAQVEGSGPCVGYLGPIGAGNYVKMVHNGIEYGDMQLIAEVYDTMQNAMGMTNEEIADTFDQWNKGILDSYLIEITAKILRKTDEETGIGHVVDYVMDKTGSKGTGKWTVQEGTAKGIAIPTIAAALDARILSGLKEERVAASQIFHSASIESLPNRQEAIDDLEQALYCSKICSYAQGLSLIQAASDEYEWNVDLSECARLWTGGCIIRAKLLQDIQEAYHTKDRPANLMVAMQIALNEKVTRWRRAIVRCVTAGIACPALMNSMAYFDTYRRERLPAKLTQCQRDFFGGHSVERVDRDGHFHVAWTDAHKDIGDVNERIAGETVQT